MSAYNIVLKPSVFAIWAMRVIALLPICILVFCSLSLLVVLLSVIIFPLYYVYWYRLYISLKQTLSFSLSDYVAIHAVSNDFPSGKLIKGGLVSEHFLRLNLVRSLDKKHVQKWVFADQCSNDEYRALSRAINQMNWSGSA